MDQAPRRVPKSWLDALERARADIAAGRVSELAAEQVRNARLDSKG